MAFHNRGELVSWGRRPDAPIKPGKLNFGLRRHGCLLKSFRDFIRRRRRRFPVLTGNIINL
jgi:hypothetical protein